MVRLRAEYTLSLSTPTIVSLIHPTPVATFCMGPYGVARLLVSTQCDGPIYVVEVTLPVIPSETHRCTRSQLIAPIVGKVSWFGLHLL